MEVKELLKVYSEDAFVLNIADKIKSSNITQIKGLSGSLDSVVASSIFKNNPEHNIFIFSDKDDASYFYNDLLNLVGEESVFLFPMSYKKPYQYEEFDNANILQRSEVLNKLNDEKSNLLIVTYPEALSEKVINRKSLLANTLTIKQGEKFDINFISELLISYEFEKSDFVYEAGQFSIRGGIVDIFSYASEYPYRIELFGDEIDSIRTFNPESQLSIQVVNQINIIPDVQSKLIQESRETFFNFIRYKSIIWIKDVDYLLEQIENCFDRAKHDFESILQHSGGIKIIESPEELFETRRGFLNEIKKFKIVEFGTRFHFKDIEKVIYNSKTQPSFNKDFKRLIENLKENQLNKITNVIAADTFKQLERLKIIFHEIDPFTSFQSLQISLRGGFIDEQTQVVCYTDHQIFDRYHRYKVRDKFSKSKALTLKELKALQIGDYVTHIDYGIGRFVGMEKIQIGEREQEVIRLIYKDNDILFVNIHSLHKIAKYSGKDGVQPSMNKLGSGEWDNKKSKVKKQVKDIAKELIALYAKRHTAHGYQFSKDNFMQVELESSFIYEDTPDQAKATADVKADMEKQYPMDRLVCGDVGFGKTEVAIRAAFKSVCDSKQVAILVPTTILAMQHQKTFAERFSNFPVNVEDISRFKTTKEINDTLQKLKDGKVDVLIGTHRLLNKDVQFKDLGLLIIDEEQKFGVKSKDRIKEIKHNVDVLTLTATPIPRTLHFSLMGARDLSVIATPPPNRQPVTTEVHVFKEDLVRDAVSYELKRGGQVFFVHNRVNDIESIANIILRLVPDARIAVAHGQMDGDRLEKVMMRFIDGEIDVLISTNIIESGLDIPNANTIIINQAQNFGMSDLHQMRGRVGRSNKKAFCYLLTPPISLLSKDGRKRLQTLEEFSDLGDGFKVAMRDLDIRGAGNLLGAEQTGFINDLGYEMYHKILDEAVQELKENEFKGLFKSDIKDVELRLSDCQIETDLQILIPENYIANISERLALYNQLDSIAKEDELEEFQKSLIDRFGNLPNEVKNLIKIVRIRWKGEEIGFEKLSLKNNILKAYYVSSERSEYFESGKFGKILDYVKSNPKRCSLKEFKGKPLLTIENITAIDDFDNVLSEILAF